MNIDDLKGLVNLIDVVTSRGAIKGEEMFTVGTYRQKLVQFIEEAEEAQLETSEEPDYGQDTEEEQESE